MGFVQQQDILMQTMTVYECLLFAAKMKLPPNVNKEKRVEILITDLKLTHCRNTMIGGQFVRGISGGEKKRASIGVEIITDPSLVFLDEPTTGLDSYTATNIIEIISELAQSGRTAVCTIHQPNSDIFAFFDKLMLIANGKTIYFNESKKAKEYFASLGQVCPPLSNPADFYIDILSVAYIEKDFKTKEEVLDEVIKSNENYNKFINHLAFEYQKSELKLDLENELNDSKSIKAIESFEESYAMQFWYLLIRAFKNIARHPEASYAKVITVTAMVIMVI